jgi:CRISPR system Cascade subunit CasE
MIASVLRLSNEDCRAERIVDAYGLHRAVYSLFPPLEGEARDFLFADKGSENNSRRILILSKRKPLDPKYGTIESKNVPDNFLDFKFYGFETIVNPTKREKTSGRIVAIRSKALLVPWFE